MKVIVEGKSRARIVEYLSTYPYYQILAKVVKEVDDHLPESQGAPEAGPGPLRGLSQAQPEHQLGLDHPGPAGEHARADHRHHRLPRLHAPRGEAEPARDGQQLRAPAPAQLRPGERDPQDPLRLPEGPQPGRPAADDVQGPARPEAFPARRARRPQGRPAQRDRGAPPEGGQGQDAPGRRGEGLQGDRAAGDHAADVGRGHGQPELPGLAHLPALDQEDRARSGSSRRPSGSSTRTTTAWRRSRSGSSSTCPSASWSRTPGASSWGSSGRPASARARSASPSPGRRAGSSSACPSAACATRPRSGATGGPTSGPIPAASSR